jgi:hypothetical protein
LFAPIAESAILKISRFIFMPLNLVRQVIQQPK